MGYTYDGPSQVAMPGAWCQFAIVLCVCVTGFLCVLMCVSECEKESRRERESMSVCFYLLIGAYIFVQCTCIPC